MLTTLLCIARARARASRHVSDVRTDARKRAHKHLTRNARDLPVAPSSCAFASSVRRERPKLVLRSTQKRYQVQAERSRYHFHAFLAHPAAGKQDQG